MKIKTNELNGAQLDWAVAKAEGLLSFGYDTDGKRFWVVLSTGETEFFSPRFEWAQGGPIIERERIRLDQMPYPKELWIAGHDSSHDMVSGPTPLVAAMRCYVASKLGDEIEIPEEIKNV